MNIITKNKFLLLALSSLAVALIAGATVAVLILTSNQAKDTGSAAAPATTAGDVIAYIETSFTSRSDKGYVVVPREAAQSLDVLLPGGDGAAGYLVPTSHVVSLTGASKETASTVNQLLVAQLTSDGFSHTPSPTDFIEEQFVKESLVCQMSSFADLEGVYQINVACTDRNDHTQFIQTISQQIKLVPDLDLTAIAYYASRVFTKDDISISVVSTTPASESVAPSELLFVKQSKAAAWEYIANLSSGDPQLSDGKFVQSEALKQALQNETYGKVLNEYLYGIEPAAQS